MTAAALVAGGVGPDASMPQAQAGIGRPTVTNAKALLRYSLPIDNKPIRKVQRELEAISDELRVPGGCCAALSWRAAGGSAGAVGMDIGNGCLYVDACWRELRS